MYEFIDIEVYMYMFVVERGKYMLIKTIMTLIFKHVYFNKCMCEILYVKINHLFNKTLLNRNNFFMKTNMNFNI